MPVEEDDIARRLAATLSGGDRSSDRFRPHRSCLRRLGKGPNAQLTVVTLKPCVLRLPKRRNRCEPHVRLVAGRAPRATLTSTCKTANRTSPRLSLEGAEIDAVECSEVGIDADSGVTQDALSNWVCRRAHRGQHVFYRCV